MPPNLLSPLGSFTSIAATAAAAVSHAVTTLAAVNTNEEHLDVLPACKYVEMAHLPRTRSSGIYPQPITQIVAGSCMPSNTYVLIYSNSSRCIMHEPTYCFGPLQRLSL